MTRLRPMQQRAAIFRRPHKRAAPTTANPRQASTVYCRRRDGEACTAALSCHGRHGSHTEKRSCCRAGERRHVGSSQEPMGTGTLPVPNMCADLHGRAGGDIVLEAAQLVAGAWRRDPTATPRETVDLPAPEPVRSFRRRRPAVGRGGAPGHGHTLAVAMRLQLSPSPWMWPACLYASPHP